LLWLCSLLALPLVTTFTLAAKVTNIFVGTFATMFIKVPQLHFLLRLTKLLQCFARQHTVAWGILSLWQKRTEASSCTLRQCSRAKR